MKPDETVKNLKKQLKEYHERIKHLERLNREKDNIINDYWHRIQSMRITNRLRRIIFLTRLREWITEAAIDLKKKLIDKRRYNTIVKKFSSDLSIVDQGLPLISIIILNRNGLNQLKKLFKNFKSKTGYDNYELIVVDNNSEDSSISYLTSLKEVKTIKNKSNESFSKANNKAALKANGEILLFLNNDVEPLKGWLSELVKASQSVNNKELGLIGSLLIYPNKQNEEKSLTVQHSGIHFRQENYFIRPVNSDNGKDPLEIIDLQLSQKIAVTAACVLIEKTKFLKAGGFDEQYSYGYEDVDLSLKLHSKRYKNYLCMKSVLFHYEFGTQEKDLNEVVVKRRIENAKHLKEKWYQFLFRNKINEKLNVRGDKMFSSLPLTIAIVVDDEKDSIDQDKDFGTLLKESGYSVLYLKSSEIELKNLSLAIDVLLVTCCSVDITKVTLRRNVIKVAWIQGWYDKIDDNFRLYKYDLVLVDSQVGAEYIYRNYGVASLQNSESSVSYFIKILWRWNNSKKISLKLPITNWDTCKLWGDFHLAIGLKKHFEKLQYPTTVQLHKEWNNGEDLTSDYVLVLRGIKGYSPKGSHINLMWNISHPDLVSHDEYKSYDHVFVASKKWKAQLKKSGISNVSTLLQCTDPEIFKPPQESESVPNGLLFVGNSRGVMRKIIKDLLYTNHNFSVYGRKWKGRIDDKYIKGEHIENRELYRYYGGAKILLNDHWDDMREKGFISNRIFDALSAEAIVISDEVDGLNELFDGALFTYHTPEELKKIVEYVLSNIESIKKKQSGLHEFIKQNHSFEKRAKQIIGTLEQGKYFER